MTKHIKIYSILLFILCFIAVLTACQATPEESVVVQKDTEAMLAMAGETQEEQQQKESLKDKTDVPNRVQETITELDGKLIIYVDTEVTVPEVDKVPIFTVEAAEFTQQNVDGLMKVLFKDNTAYEIERGRATKADIESYIVELERINLNYQDNPDETADIEERIAKAKENYAAAPEESEDIKEESDGQLRLIKTVLTPGNDVYEYMGLEVQTDEDEDQAKSLKVTNKGYLESDLAHPVNFSAYIHYWDLSIHTFWDNASVPINAEEVDDELLEKLRLTPDEAREMVESALAEGGIDYMKCYRMFVVDDAFTGNCDGKIAPAENYGYRMYYTREVQGIPCTYILGGISDENAVYDFPWDYEILTVTVSEKGITSMEWMSLMEVTGTSIENAALLDFDEILKRFEAQVVIENSYISPDNEDTSIEIDRIALEYQRMMIKDGGRGTALLSPVWNFYGVKTNKYSQYNIIDTDNDYVLSVNAVDGSIFDPTVGY